MQETGKNKAYHTLSLSIRLRADGFSFFVCDLQSGSLMRGEHFTLATGETIAERLVTELSRSDYFNRQINQAFVMTDAASTLVPLEEFRREEVSQLYGFLFSQKQQKHRVAYTIMPHLEAVEVFPIDCDVEDAIVQFYPTARFFGSQAMIIERLARYSTEMDSTNGHCLFCLTDTNKVSLMALEQNRLLFSNTFDATNAADALFYVLGTWKQLDYDACEDTLMMLEQKSHPDDELRHELEPYIANIMTLTAEELFSDMPLSREVHVPLQLMALLLNRF